MPRLTAEAQRAQEEAMRLKIRKTLLSMLVVSPLEEITIAQIAGRVNISSVTLYKYYSSRAELILDTFDYSRELIWNRLREILTGKGKPYNRLLETVRTMFEEGASQVNLFLATYKHFAITETLLEKRKVRMQAVIELFSAPLAEAIAAGEARQVCPESTALILFESVIGIQRDAHFRGEKMNVEQATQAIRETLLDGLFIPVFSQQKNDF